MSLEDKVQMKTYLMSKICTKKSNNRKQISIKMTQLLKMIKLMHFCLQIKMKINLGKWLMQLYKRRKKQKLISNFVILMK